MMDESDPRPECAYHLSASIDGTDIIIFHHDVVLVRNGLSMRGDDACLLDVWLMIL